MTLSPLGHTALEVTLVRARESARPDRIVDDPFAAPLALSLGATPATLARPPADEREATLAFHVAVRTRFFDEELLVACAAGCRQVVLLGAGLDTRAWRLPWPEGVRVFELDLPDVLEHKARTLDSPPACERISVAIDLREDWPRALMVAGFDHAQRTAWLAEGLLIYLDATEAERLLLSIGDLSPAGSVFMCEGGTVVTPELLAAAREQLGADHFTSQWRGGLGRDLAEWLRAHGWDVLLHDPAQLAGDYGLAETRPGADYVVAQLAEGTAGA